MNKLLQPILFVVLLVGGMMVVGCSSSPSEEELKKLTDLKAQVEQLKTTVSQKQGEKANLEKQIAEKNGKLQQCQSDQDAVKKGLGK